MDKIINLQSVVEFAYNNYKNIKYTKNIDDSLKQIEAYNPVFDVFDFDYIPLNTLIHLKYDVNVLIKAYSCKDMMYQIFYCYCYAMMSNFEKMTNIEQHYKINEKVMYYKNKDIHKIVDDVFVNIILIKSESNIEIYETANCFKYLIIVNYQDTYYFVENTYLKYFTNKSMIVIDLLEKKKETVTNNSIEYFDLATDEECIIKLQKNKPKVVLSPIITDLNTINKEELKKNALKTMKYEELQDIADKLNINTVIGQYKNGKPKYVKKDILFNLIKLC